VSPSNAKKAKATRLPQDWRPSNATVESLSRELDTDAVQHIPSFVDYWIAVPDAKGVKLDWNATFRNSVRREVRLGIRFDPPPKPQPRNCRCGEGHERDDQCPPLATPEQKAAAMAALKALTFAWSEGTP
jgi:hypothetical protein